MYFELAIEYYPESANRFDSMADYYERMGEFFNAIKYVYKAYELSANDYYMKRIERFKVKNNK